MNKDKRKILTEAAAHREREVLHHQINIDNYRLAIAEIDARYAQDASMEPFRAQLQSLLDSSRIEQTKEQILLTVIRKQLES